MEQQDILENAVPAGEYSLGELQHWLHYGKHSWSLGSGVIFFPYHLIMIALTIVAVLFTPYMLYHLFKAKWYKSVIVLLAVFVLPVTFFQFIQVENLALNFLFVTLPLVSFYLYMYIISYMIDEELNKITTLKKWKMESRTKQ